MKVLMMRAAATAGMLLWLTQCNYVLGQVPSKNGHANTCHAAALPSDITQQLRQFASWKIQQLEDLSSSARDRWNAEKPLQCPGIAEGRFAGGTTLSYAVLLVSREHRDAGYKFLIFSPKHGSSAYQMTIAEQSDRGSAANFFIHRVNINKFFDQSSKRKFGVAASDGILLADAGENEYETDVYFWANGRYQHQPIDY